MRCSSSNKQTTSSKLFKRTYGTCTSFSLYSEFKGRRKKGSEKRLQHWIASTASCPESRDCYKRKKRELLFSHSILPATFESLSESLLESESQSHLYTMDHQHDNRANQCNPNHHATGPGHAAGYHGTGDKADLDNHANQCNPNNPKCQKASDCCASPKKWSDVERVVPQFVHTSWWNTPDIISMLIQQDISTCIYSFPFPSEWFNSE